MIFGTDVLSVWDVEQTGVAAAGNSPDNVPITEIHPGRRPSPIATGPRSRRMRSAISAALLLHLPTNEHPMKMPPTPRLTVRPRFARSPRFVGWLLLIAAWLAIAPTVAEELPRMLDVDCQALVSRGDLDLTTQLGGGDDAHEIPGLTIGNGRLGTVVWTGKGPPQPRLSLLLNHVDVFAFRSSSESTRDAHQAYANGCGRVDIDMGEPVFGEQSTRSHLSVYDAVGETSGGGVRVRFFAWHRRDVIALEIIDDRAEPRPITVELRPLRRAVDTSGPHTATSTLSTHEGDVELTQEFREQAARPTARGLASFTSLRIRALGRSATASDPGDGSVRLAVPAGKGAVVILIAVGQSKEQRLADVTAAATADLDAAAALGFAGLLDDNKVFWHDFWSKSFVCMSGSPQLDEMTRFYVWSLYLSACCMRGNYPPKHNGLIFVRQDNRTWGGPFWWFNESAQQGWQYEANHGELLEPVFRWHGSNLEAYANAAERSWNSRGWYVPETSTWDGPEILPPGARKPEGRRTQYHLSSIGGGWTARNTYNMARFAALYYHKYLYTLDEEWLREQVYPAARATAEFYCGLKAGCQDAGGSDNGPEGAVILRKDDDGKYHLYGTILHEHVWWGKDIIEDMAAIRGIFPLAIALSKKYDVDADKRAEWQEVLDNLAPYPMSDEPGAIAGLGAGTWAQGRSPHGQLRGNEGDESPRMGPVVGSYLDVLTLESPAADLWATALATLDKHPGSRKQQLCSCGYYAVVPARMGRRDLVEIALPAQMVSSASQSRPGASHSLQGPGVFMRAVHAALLLSISPSPAEKPVIRVLESWPRIWDVAFRLQAKGGFLVASALRGGVIPFVEITSQLGGECLIRNPWPDEDVVLVSDQGSRPLGKESLLRIETAKGDRYLLLNGRAAPRPERIAVPPPRASQ